MPPSNSLLAECRTSPSSVFPGPATLQLAWSLDLTAAEPLHRSLEDRLAQDSRLVIDASAVERVSTPCLQVLAAAAASARALGGGLHFETPSPALSSAVRDLDLGRALGMEHTE